MLNGRVSSKQIALSAFATLAFVSSACLAQTAALVVTHNDVDGIVTPGQTVRVAAILSWAPGGPDMLREIEGSLRASPDIGAAANPAFPYTISPSPVVSISPGTGSAGSVVGVRLFNGDLNWLLFGFPPPEPWRNGDGLIVVQYDWTAPATPGVVAFDWSPSPTNPQTIMAFHDGPPSFRAVPTTYLGTSLTVIPAPPAALALGLCGATGTRRRR